MFMKKNCDFKKKNLLLALVLTAVFVFLTACGNDTLEIVPADKDKKTTQGADYPNPTSGEDRPNPTQATDREPTPTDIPGGGEDPVDDPDDNHPPKLSELKIDKKYLMGIKLRNKVDFGFVADLMENITCFSDAQKVFFGSERDITELTITEDSQVESIFSQASEYMKLGDPVAIVINGNVTIDGDVITNEGSYKTNPKTSLSGISLIVKSGSTLTLKHAGMSIGSSYMSGDEFPFFIVENGAKLVVSKDTYINADEAFLVALNGSTVEVIDSSVSFLSIVNLGKMTVSTVSPAENYFRTYVNEDDFFYNGKNAEIYINDALLSACIDDYQYRYGWTVGKYDEDSYGTYDPDAYRFSDILQHNPKAYNFGLIEVNGNGECGMEFQVSINYEEALQLMPAVNLGTINLIGKGRHQLETDGHFQNYGTINITGSLDTDRWGDSEALLYGYNLLFENYGTIECGTGKGFAMSVAKTFINYEGATVTENRPKKYGSLTGNVSFYDGIDADRDYREIDPLTAEMIKDSNWRNLYMKSGTDGKDTRFKFYSSDHKITVDISLYFGEKFYFIYKQYNLYELLDGDHLTIKDYSDSYGGNTVITISPSENFESIEYTIKNDSYGEDSGKLNKSE